MPLSGSTLVRLIDGRNVSLAELAATRPPGINIRLFAVQNPEQPVALAGRTFPGLVVGHEARLPRVTRPDHVCVDVMLSTGDFVRCAPSQLFLTQDGVWKAAERLRPGEFLRPLVTDLMPDANPDLAPVPDMAPDTPGSHSLIFPEISVLSVSMSGYEDLWDLEVPRDRNYGLAARVFAQAV